MNFHIKKDAGRRVVRRRSQAAQDADELAYWLAVPAEDRIEAAAFMSRRSFRLRGGGEFPRLDKTAGQRVPRLKDCLLLNKRAAGRPKDLRDVKALSPPESKSP